MEKHLRSAFSLLLLGCMASTFHGCTATAHTADFEVMAETPSPVDYTALPDDKPLMDFVGQKVWFTGEVATVIHQHMMKVGPPDENGKREKHTYLDFHGGSQLVAYSSGIALPQDGFSHRYFGILRAMSGAGKGGGMHTEIYLDLHKVE